jgi:O-acetylhomoserine/O-acetylserine sulfhydrylase-like pyridoxal-dependent enzyme
MSTNPFLPKGFGSLAVHGGHKQDPNYAHLTPIYASSTYVYDTAEQGCGGLQQKNQDISMLAGATPP